MPKRTAILLLLIATAMLALVRIHEWFYETRFLTQWAQTFGERSLPSVVSFWAAISTVDRRQRTAVAVATTFFVVAEVVVDRTFFPTFAWSLRTFYRLSLCLHVSHILGLSAGSWAAGRLLAVQGLSLSVSQRVDHEFTSFRIRYSLRVLLLLTFLSAAYLGLATQVHPWPAGGWKSYLPIGLLRFLGTFPEGLFAGTAGWAMLLPGSPIRRVAIGFPICAVPTQFMWLGLDFSIYLSGFLDAAAYYLILLGIFWSLRSAGYRLVWRENTLLADNPIAG